MPTLEKIRILGIDFVNTTAQEVTDALKAGGLMVVPSGPGLATIEKDKVYYQSLLTADIVLPDSGYMALLWNLTHRKKIKRISGLEFLENFIADKDVKSSNDILLIDPRSKEAQANRDYLLSQGFTLGGSSSYLAPMYDKNDVTDESLLGLIERQKPKYILVNLGGGIQEKLGAFLRTRLTYKPAIICTGAAIAFLTGHQASIPTWADRLYLGWLARCIADPKVYIPRYFGSFGLALVMARYGRNGPV